MTGAKGLRLAITGASSSGKTTLSKALMHDARFFPLVDALIPERARTLLENCGYVSFDEMSREELRDLQRQLFTLKLEEESRINRYLVDRSFVDMAATWIERDTFDQPKNAQDELVIPCRREAKKYTLQFYLPAQSLAFEHDQVRESDISLHRRIDTRIRQYLEEWQLQYVFIQSTTLEMRVNEVCSELKRRGVISLQA
jgi:hypothetical protein